MVNPELGLETYTVEADMPLKQCGICGEEYSWKEVIEIPTSMDKHWTEEQSIICKDCANSKKISMLSLICPTPEETEAFQKWRMDNQINDWQHFDFELHLQDEGEHKELCGCYDTYHIWLDEKRNRGIFIDFINGHFRIKFIGCDAKVYSGRLTIGDDLVLVPREKEEDKDE